MTTDAGAAQPGGSGTQDAPTRPLSRPRLEEGGYLARLSVVTLLGLVTAAVVALLLWRGELAARPTMFALELSGTRDRATAWLDAKAHWYGDTGDVYRVLIWNLALTALLFAVLGVVAARLGEGSLRVRAWRAASRSLTGLAVIGTALEVLGDLGAMLGTVAYPSSEWWVGWVWMLVAAVVWAKLLALFALAGYCLVAAHSYVATPHWVQELLRKDLSPDPLEPDLQMSADDSVTPESSAAATMGWPSDGSAGPRFGIAVAGGGVRSAALALGALQQLETQGDQGPSWTTAQKVASVSGGSYMAGGLSVARSSREGGRLPSCTAQQPSSLDEPDGWPPRPPGPCPDSWRSGARKTASSSTTSATCSPRTRPATPRRPVTTRPVSRPPSCSASSSTSACCCSRSGSSSSRWPG